MYIHETKSRVRYADTDQMGYMYYGNYATFYEIGRVEMLRSLGMSYRAMEEQGVMLPVLELKCKYIRPALYDQEITIKTIIETLPATRIHFKYELYNEENVLINFGETTLVFVSIEKNKPCLAPEYFLERIKPYFST